MLDKHFLVVSHRSLTRWTPCRPEIQQNYLTLAMSNGSGPTFDDVLSTFNRADLTTQSHSVGWFKFNFNSFYALKCLFQFSVDYICSFFHFKSGITFNNHKTLVNLLLLIRLEHVNNLTSDFWLLQPVRVVMCFVDLAYFLLNYLLFLKWECRPGSLHNTFFIIIY